MRVNKVSRQGKDLAPIPHPVDSSRNFPWWSGARLDFTGL